MFACYHVSQVEVVKLLVNAGACIAAASSSDTMGAVAANTGSTPLHLAAMKVGLAGQVGIGCCAWLLLVSAKEGQRQLLLEQCQQLLDML
jgi:hypothetical protein